VQRGLNEGRLRFGDKEKPQMQVDGDPLKDVDAMYMEVASCNVVEAVANAVKILSVKEKDDVVECQMAEVSINPKDEKAKAYVVQYSTKRLLKSLKMLF
jgi:hypothetical protein